MTEIRVSEGLCYVLTINEPLVNNEFKKNQFINNTNPQTEHHHYSEDQILGWLSCSIWSNVHTLYNVCSTVALGVVCC